MRARGDVGFVEVDMGVADYEGVALWGDWLLSVGTRGDRVRVDSRALLVDDAGRWCLVTDMSVDLPAQEYGPPSLQDAYRTLARPTMPPLTVQLERDDAGTWHDGDACRPIWLSRKYHDEWELAEIAGEHGLPENMNGVTDLLVAAWEHTRAAAPRERRERRTKSK